jgi:hypothetical protein
MKYCNECKYFLKKSFECKVFGYTLFEQKNQINKIPKKIVPKIYYYPVDYVRGKDYLCGIDARYFNHRLK